MHGVDDRNLQVLTTLAVVMVCYAAANRLDASGPIAMVVAGLFVGNEGMEYAASGGAQEYLRKFWSLLDNIINSVLFLLIGLEFLIIVRSRFGYWIGPLVVPVALAGRVG